MISVQFAVSGYPPQNTVTMNSKPFSHDPFGLHLWCQSHKKKAKAMPIQYLDLFSTVAKYSLSWDSSTVAERGKFRPQPAAEQNKKIARKTVGIIKGQHNPFIFLKVLMRKSCVCICSASPLLPSPSYHRLGLPDLLVEEQLVGVHSSGYQATDH